MFLPPQIVSWVWAFLGFRFSAVSNETVVSIHQHNEVETLVIVLAACMGWFLDGYMPSISGPSNDPLEDRWYKFGDVGLGHSEETEERDITIYRCHVSQVGRKLDPEIQRPWTWLFIYPFFCKGGEYWMSFMHQKR